MASCTQIEAELQAWLDGELGLSERVIFEQHVAECGACTALVRQHQRTTATMYEVFREHRLARNLRGAVLEHLPELSTASLEKGREKWRKSAPREQRTWWGPLIPILAACAVLTLAGILYIEWPTYPDASPAIGMITQSSGNTKVAALEDDRQNSAEVKGYVACGQSYETGPDSTLMLALRGPTHVKVDQNSRVKVYDDRQLTVEKGRIWLEVSKDERAFRVTTPAGDITVHGTVFAVDVSGNRTLVTLQEGKVEVRNGVAKSELKPGEQLDIAVGMEEVHPKTADVAHEMKWAERIVPDSAAYDLFAREVQPRTVAELPAEQVYVVIPSEENHKRAISSFTLTWEPDGVAASHCGYDVRVYSYDPSSATKQEIFREHVDGSVFSDPSRSSYKIHVPGKPIANVGMLHIKLMPDFSVGSVKTSFSNVSALGI